MSVILTFRKRPTPKRFPVAEKLARGTAEAEVILFPSIQRVYHGAGASASTALMPDGSVQPVKEH